MPDRRYFNREELVATVQGLSGFPPEGIRGYLIGGFAMTLMDAKAATKDIDVVFGSDSQAAEFEGALGRAGFFPKDILSQDYVVLHTRNVMVDAEGRQLGQIIST